MQQRVCVNASLLFVPAFSAALVRRNRKNINANHAIGLLDHRYAALQKRETILPPDLFEQYSKLSFWQDGSQSRANVITIKNNQNQ